MYVLYVKLECYFCLKFNFRMSKYLFKYINRLYFIKLFV